MVFVNWSFLEKQLPALKRTAKNEVLNPTDRNFIENPNQVENNLPGSTEESEKATEAPREPRSAPMRTIDVDDADAEIEYIEVENAKGQIKRINPNDYEVQIMAGDRHFRSNLKDIASGVYLSIATKFGARSGLETIVRDFVRQPNDFVRNSLTFKQAKLVLTAISGKDGRVSKQAELDVINKTVTNDRVQLQKWIFDCNSRFNVK